MRLETLICAIAALPLLVAFGCSNGGGGAGGKGAGGQGTTGPGTGGQGTTTGPGAGGMGGGAPHCGSGGQNVFLVTEDVCIDGTSGSCALGDSPLNRACTADTDCPQSTVCRQCDATRSFCDGTCLTDSNCSGGTCDATGHCHPKACAASSDCPKNFTCSSADGICVRKTCTGNADCEGFCLSGRCAASEPSCASCI